MDRLTKLTINDNGRKIISCIHKNTDKCFNNGNCLKCQILSNMISKLYFVENFLDETEKELSEEK